MVVERVKDYKSTSMIKVAESTESEFLGDCQMKNPAIYQDHDDIASYYTCVKYLKHKTHMEEAVKTSDHLYRSHIRDRVTQTTKNSIATYVKNNHNEESLAPVRKFAMCWMASQTKAKDAVEAFYNLVLEAIGPSGDLVLKSKPSIIFNEEDSHYYIYMQLAYVDFD